MGNVVLRQVTLAIASTLGFLLTMYRWIVIAGVVLSWVNPDPYNPIVRFVRGVTEPVFYQVRRRLPFVVVSGIDLSPIVVLLGVEVVRMVLVGSLYELAYRLAAATAGIAVG
jgi:YggT family protein